MDRNYSRSHYGVTAQSPMARRGQRGLRISGAREQKIKKRDTEPPCNAGATARKMADGHPLPPPLSLYRVLLRSRELAVCSKCARDGGYAQWASTSHLLAQLGSLRDVVSEPIIIFRLAPLKRNTSFGVLPPSPPPPLRFLRLCPCCPSAFQGTKYLRC